MQITYKIDYPDFLEAQKAVLGQRRNFAWFLGLLFTIMGVLRGLAKPHDYAGAASLIVLGLILTLCWRWRVWRMYQRDRRFNASYQAEISELGINVVGPTSASQFQWQNFIGHKITERSIVLLHSPSVFNTFPKSAFNETDLRAFTDLVVRHVPPFVTKHSRVRFLIFLAVLLFVGILLGIAIWRIQQ